MSITIKIEGLNVKKNGLINAVIFDLGRVLVQVDTQKLWDFFFTNYADGDVQQALGRIMADPMMMQYSIGRIPTQEFYQKLHDDYRLDLSYEAFVFRWCDIFAPMEGMDSIVAQLSGKVRLGLLSDTDPLHWDFIRRHYPLMQYFPKPTLSFEIGSVKPSRDSYLAAACAVGVPPEECLFIDDLQKNVDGAKAAGMAAIRFEGADPLRSYLAGIHLL